MGYYDEERERLQAYAEELAGAGFRVWLRASTPVGYLTYQDTETGCWGTFQRSEFEGWQHLMPIAPSRENGSSMYLDTTTDPWTVEAAHECARAENYNSMVGRQSNAKAWLSPDVVEVVAES